MALQSRPEPMNASPYHPKVTVSLTTSDKLYVAGGAVTGKMEVKCRADKGLGLGVIMVELYAIEELTSRDHSATSTFLHTRRLFQGPGLPPSNAVLPHPIAGNPLPAHYHESRRGLTTFLFRLPIPSTSPSSINFGSGLARIRYEVRATVGVSWKGENRLVVDRGEVDVAESYELDFDRIEPEGVIVGEHGKIWVQAKVVGGLVVAGESACVELQVKNHSSKKTTGLRVALTRHLHLCGLPSAHKPPLQISDTLTSVNFRGPEYTAQPGSEGIAQLVFDTPVEARTVKGGDRQGDEEAHVLKEPLFEVRCFVNVKLCMPIGSKDIHLDLPVTIFHPVALPPPPPIPELPLPLPASPPIYHVPPFFSPESTYALDSVQAPHAYPFTPPPQQPLPKYSAIQDQQQYWNFMQSNSPRPNDYPYPFPPSPYLVHPYHPAIPMQYAPPPRPSSVEPPSTVPLQALPSGLPPLSNQHVLMSIAADAGGTSAEPEEGKGERASRVSHHLRTTSRHRSVSPQSHRFPVPNSTVQLHFTPVPPADVMPTPQGSPSHVSLSSSQPLSPCSSQGPADVISPRPLASPKRSCKISFDPATGLSLSKSDRVVVLEEMAAAEEQQELMKSELDLEKTLPPPPVPSGKDRVMLRASRPRADIVFASHEEQETAVSRPVNASAPTPKTPTLSGLSLLKPPRTANLCDHLSPGSAESSGLDALERRLLAEVGTRKMEEKGRADVRSVLGISNPLVPIDIPRANGGGAAELDSAISSLTLGDEGANLGIGKLEQEREKASGRVRLPILALDESDDLATGEEPEPDRISDERTQKQGRSVSGESDRGTRKGKARSTASSGKGKEKKKKKEKGQKDEEAAKLRKAAKGRVAEWLGKLEAVPVDEASSTEIKADFLKAPEDVVDAPAPSAPVSPLLSPVDLSDTDKSTGKALPATLSPDMSSPSAVPFNVSSVSASPILSALLDGTRPGITRNTNVTETRYSEPAKDQKPEMEISSAAPNPRSSGFVPASTLRGYSTGPLARSSRLPRSSTHNSHSPVPTPPNDAPNSPRARYEAAFRATSPSPSHSRAPPTKPVVQKRVLMFPPRPKDVQVKHDIRSARGGKGGQVTAVTAIWGSAATSKADNPVAKPNARPVTSPKPTAAPAPAGKHRTFLDIPKPKAVPTPRKISPGSTPVLGPAKGTSVPAMISSSHASPMLSSTASLARPAVPQRKERAAPQPTIPGVPPVTSPPPSKAKREDLMFGQARLRDLIKKYQGQTA